MLEIGDEAPDFEMESTEGTVHLYDYKGKKNVILIFYPLNNTPGCRKQLCEARDHLADYDAYDTVVIGMNPGKFAGHEKFAKKHDFGFPLVHDERWQNVVNYKVLTAFSVMQARTVYIIDKQMKIRYVYKGHPPLKTVMQVLQEIEGNQIPTSTSN